MIRESKFEIILKKIVWILLSIMVMPFLRAASLANFRADDFNWLNYISSEGNPVAVSLRYAAYTWKNWQGTFLSSFLVPLLSPLNRYSYVQLRIILIALILLSVAGLFFSIREILRHFRMNISPVYLFALILMPMLSYREYYDIYIWYTGAMVYLVPVICLELGVTLLLRSKDKKKTSSYIGALLFLAAMTGGNIEVTGLAMCILIVLVAEDWAFNRKPDAGFLAAFAVALTGALFNAFSPGNFIRAEASGGNYHEVLSAVVFSFKMTWMEFTWFQSHATFLIIELIAFVFGTRFDGKPRPAVFAILLAAVLFTTAITVFPVELAYMEGDNELTNRCMFPFDIALTISCVVASVTAGCIVGQSFRNQEFLARKNENHILCALLAVILLISFVSDGADRSVSVEVADDILDGDVAYSSYCQRQIYDELLGNSEEADVVIDYIPEHVSGSTYVELFEDPNNTTNMIIARYYGKNSVIYVPKG